LMAPGMDKPYLSVLKLHNVVDKSQIMNLSGISKPS